MPVFDDAGALVLPTPDQLTRVRQLTADADDPPRLSDADLTARIVAAPSCPIPADAPAGTLAEPDLYTVAAVVWEDRALELELQRASAPVEEPVRVTSARNGDVSETYGGGGKLATGQAPVLTPQAMRAVAGRLRKRSCTRPGAVRSVTILGPSERPLTMDPLTGLFPGQAVNGPL